VVFVYISSFRMFKKFKIDFLAYVLPLILGLSNIYPLVVVMGVDISFISINLVLSYSYVVFSFILGMMILLKIKVSYPFRQV